MPGAGGDDNHETVGDRVWAAVDDNRTCAGLDSKKLVDVVDLGADIFAGLKTHDDQLAGLGGIQHLAEVGIGRGQIFDIGNVSPHGLRIIVHPEWKRLGKSGMMEGMREKLAGWWGIVKSRIANLPRRYVIGGTIGAGALVIAAAAGMWIWPNMRRGESLDQTLKRLMASRQERQVESDFTKLTIPQRQAAFFSLKAEKDDKYGLSPGGSLTLTAQGDVNLDMVKNSLESSVPISVTAVSGREFRLTPRQALALDQELKVRLAVKGTAWSGGSIDRDYGWAFQAAGKFRVTGGLPGENKKNVPVNTGIEITFSQEDYQDPGSLLSINPEVKYRIERHAETLAVVPEKPLEKKTIYTVTLKKGLNLTSRNDPIEADYSFSFQTTGDDPGESPPRLWVNDDFIQVGVNEAPALKVFTSNWGADRKATAEVYRFADKDKFMASRKDIDGAYGGWYSYFAENSPVDTANMAMVGKAELALMEKEFLNYLQFPGGLPDGFYLIKLWMDDKKQLQQVWVQSTDLSGYLSVGRRQTLVWANDRGTGEPVTATIRTPGQAGSYSTSGTGVAVFGTPETLLSAKPGYVELTTDDGKAVVLPLRGVQDTTNTGEDWWSLIYRERRFYKPSDKIYFWGVAKNRETGAAPGNIKAGLVRGYNSDNLALAEQNISVNSDGTYTGSQEFTDLPAGWYSLVIKLADGTVLASDAVEIKEYEKPEMKIEVAGDKQAMFAGEKANFAAKTSFFDGTPVRDIKLHVYEDQAGNTADMTTDRKGEIKYTLEAKYSGNYDNYPRYESVAITPALAVAGKIEGYGSVYVFGSKLMIEAQTTMEGKRAKVDVKVNRVDLNKFGKGEFQSVKGEPKGGEQVTVNVTKTWYERQEAGTRYDFVEKVTVPQYTYTRHEENLPEVKVTTNGNGEARYEMDVEAERSYQIKTSVTDQDKHPATANTYAYYYEGQSAYEQNQSAAPLISLTKSDNYYSLGEKVQAQVTQNGKEVTLGEHGRILYIVAAQGRQDYFVETEPSLTFDLAKKHVPNAYVAAVVFSGKHYILAGAPCEWDWSCYYGYNEYYWEGVEVRYQKTDSQVKVAVEPEAEKYKAGQEAKIKVKVTKDGQGVSNMEVNMAVVDEALAAIGGVIAPDTLNQLYRPLRSMMYYSYYTHKPLEPNPPVAERGGGGGEFREAFKDTAYFATARTDSEGTAEFAFTLPDNLTTWLVYAQAVSDDLLAGQGESKVVVTQDFLVTSNFPKNYLTADRPLVTANAFGTALTGAETVNYTATVFSGDREKDKRQAAGKAFGDIGMAIPELSPGEYALGLLGKSGSHEDGVKYPFEVRESIWEFAHSKRYTLTAGGLLPDLALGEIVTDRPVTVVVTDAGKGRYYWELKNYCFLSSNRLEKRIAKARAGQIAAAEFGDDSCTADPVDKQKFQSEDGGLAQVVWGGSNLETTAWAVHTDPTGWVKDKLMTYFLGKTSEGQAGSVQKIYGWWGVSELGGPGLRQLKRLAQQAISFEEKVTAGLALAFIGDEETARELYYDILADYAYTNKPYVRIQRDGSMPGDANRQIKDTAWALLLGAEAVSEYNEGMDIYLGHNAYTAEDIVLDLARIEFIRDQMAKAPPGDTKFTVTTPIKTVTDTLSQAKAKAISLTADEAAKTTVKVTGGQAEITANYYVGTKGVAALKTDDRLKLTRAIKKVNGGGDIRAGDMVEVRLDYDFGREGPKGGYTIKDYLPAGLIYLENPDAYGLKSAWRVGHSGNVITAWAYNSPWWRDRDVTYYARAGSGGTYIAEPAVFQANADLEVFTITGSDTVKIGVGQ